MADKWEMAALGGLGESLERLEAGVTELLELAKEPRLVPTLKKSEIPPLFAGQMWTYQLSSPTGFGPILKVTQCDTGIDLEVEIAGWRGRRLHLEF